ncbi:Uncharacterized protein TCM_007445 [Theobroma cacao]|uniref:Uncharacterized protein n=1 Tax=Theobroma cacao TaxID=3641 RepID=A0A061E925_THECC|nr:Uncharacterized protein TCM_007445 [Theobroma cacao]
MSVWGLVIFFSCRLCLQCRLCLEQRYHRCHLCQVSLSQQFPHCQLHNHLCPTSAPFLHFLACPPFRPCLLPQSSPCLHCLACPQSPLSQLRFHPSHSSPHHLQKLALETVRLSYLIYIYIYIYRERERESMDRSYSLFLYTERLLPLSSFHFMMLY